MIEGLDWNDLRVFLEIADAKSLREASKKCGITQPTLGRHLTRLEDELGLDLVSRHSRGIVLTEHGELVRRHALTVKDSVTVLTRALSERRADPSGTVVVSATDVVGQHAVLPIMNDLSKRFPNVTFQLIYDNWATDLQTGTADIAIRMFKPKTAGLIAKSVTKVPVGVYAKRGTPKASLDELQDVPWISFADPTIRKRAFGGKISKPRLTFLSDSISSQFEACRLGFGYAVVQHRLAAAYDLTLVCDVPEATLPMWIVVNEDVRDTPAVRVAFDGLATGLAEFYR